MLKSIDKKQFWPVLAFCLVGLPISLGFWVVSPISAQEKEQVSFVFAKIDVASQSVQFRDTAGNDLGNGRVSAHVTNSHGDPAGDIVAVTVDSSWSVRIDVSRVDEIIYDENGNTVGVALSGRGTLTEDGQTETFAATVTARYGTTFPLEDILISNNSGPMPDGFSLVAQGRLEFRES